MTSLLRRVYLVLVYLLVAGCSGGGCSSCAGGAIHPIAGGFPLTPERRVPHAMQVRVTDQGLRSLGSIAPDVLSGFVSGGIPIPRTTQGLGVGKAVICPSNNCKLTVELTSNPPALQFGFKAPDQLTVKARVIVRGTVPTQVCVGSCSDTCTGTLCTTASRPSVNIDTRRGSHPFVGLSTAVAVRRDTHRERQSYYRADLVSPTGSGDAVQETTGEGIETDDITFSNSVLAPLFNLFRGVIVGQFRDQLGRAIAPIQTALSASTTPSPPGCPTGTRACSGEATRCCYSDGSKVPILLGVDGTGNIGALLASVSPGLLANASYVLAAGDPTHAAESSSTGMTVNVFGGVISGEHNACVPRMTAPSIPNIPEWMALRRNTVPGGSTTTSLGVGLSEDFLNLAVFQLWDAGLFCLRVGTSTAQQIATGTFGALPGLSSLRAVVFPQSSAAALLALRPQQPPRITVGGGTDPSTDPLLTLEMRQLAVDFYAWSEERYVRFMTASTDLTVPANLTTEGNGLRLVFGTAKIANTMVTNSQLLTSPPGQIAALLQGLLGTAISQAGAALPVISLPTVPVPGAGGRTVGRVSINVSDRDIRGISEGSSRFLGVFASLVYQRGVAATAQLDTTADVRALPYDRRVYEFGPSFALEQLPRFRLQLGTPGDFARDVEYSYRVDGMQWSAWNRERVVDVASTAFMAQGQHSIEARARMAGEPATADEVPARVDVVIDTAPPTARVQRSGDRLVAEGSDNVAPREQLQYRIAFDSQPAGEWSSDNALAVPAGARSYVVAVRDPSGNEAQVSGTVPQAIVDDSTTTPGVRCQAGLPGATGAASPWALLTTALVTLAAVVRPRRRTRTRLALSCSALLTSALVLGSCSGNSGPNDGGDNECMTGSQLCTSTHQCVTTPICQCPVGQMPTGEPRFDAARCTYDSSPTVCACMPIVLASGMVGSHLDLAVSDDDNVWLSSYSAGDPFRQRPYGDLLVGRFDRARGELKWEHVDGVPNARPTADPMGWRGGVVEPGDDVGRWNSIAVDAMGRPRVAYWDATHDQLKYAAYDGTRWQIHAVDRAGHNGRYASLVLLAGDVPAIAYRSTVRETTGGRITARVRYAVAESATPGDPSAWTITDVASAPTSCRASDCGAGEVCVRSTGACARTTGDCSQACTGAMTCVGGACVDTYPSNWIEDMPPGIGLFCSLALDSMGRPQLVFYDHDKGNLMGARVSAGTTWSRAVVIDGDDDDRGAWASLAVASDDSWRVAYVDVGTRRLLYATVRNGTRSGEPEVIDDGADAGGAAFTDGNHFVGDGAALELTAAGTARVAYQDTTAGSLRFATRAGSGWTRRLLEMPGHTGYWANLEKGVVATFARDMTRREFGVRVVPAP